MNSPIMYLCNYFCFRGCVHGRCGRLTISIMSSWIIIFYHTNVLQSRSTLSCVAQSCHVLNATPRRLHMDS